MMMPLRSLRSRVVHLEEEKSKENDKDSRIKQKKMPLTVISCDANELKDPKKAKTLGVATLKKKPVIENMNKNNACTVNESGKENVLNKRNLRNKTEKFPETKLSVLKENNTNLQNIAPVAAVMKNTKTKDQKSVKEKVKLSSKCNSSKPSGDKKTCNLLQTQLPVLKENNSSIEREGTEAAVTKTKKNGTVKREAKSKAQNKPIGKINCMRIDSYFKRPVKENNCVVEGTETEVNAVKKFPIWKKLEVSKIVQAKKQKRRSTKDVYDIALDEDLLASSKKSKNTKTRVNQMKKRMKKDNKKRLNYPKCSIKKKCTSVKVDKVLARETKVVTPGDFGAKTASEEKQNNLPKNTSSDNNGFHDGNKNQNIPEQITNYVEIADVHHTGNEIQNFAAESFEINDSDEILKRSEQIVGVNNIEKADVLKESENRNFSAASFEIDDHPNEILELSDCGIYNIESAGVDIETENINVPMISFEIDNPNEILTEPSVDAQQSKCISNRKIVTELADQLERSFQIYLTSTPDRSHKSRIPAQKSGIFNVADLSNITVNSNCLNTFISSPTGSSSDNVAMPTVTTDAEINTKDNDAIAESLPIAEPPPKKKSKKDTADITLFESPKKNVEKKKKKEQKPISFYLFQDLEAPPAELEESVLKPKKTYKEADNLKVHIMRTKRNAAAAAKQVAKKTKVDLLVDNMIKHFEEIGSTEFCIEKV